MEELSKIQDFLQENSDHRIDIFDYKTKQKFHRKLSYNNLLESNNTIQSLITNIHQTYNLSEIGIQKFKPNGSSKRKVGEPIVIDSTIKVTINTQEKNILPKEMFQKTEARAIESQPAIARPVSDFQSFNYGMNSPMGMGMPEVISLHTKAERYEELKEKNNDLRSDKRKLEREIDALTIENRELKTDLALADKKLDLEIKNIKSERKPILDPTITNGLLGVLKEVAPAMMASKIGATGMQGTETPKEELSDVKTVFFDFLKSEMSDAMAEELLMVGVGLIKSKNFTEELRASIKKHNLENII
ncbi:hypothetical protein V2647_07780 [Tenacibaculum maritimum]|uniref:hypothetical protein n=1 Tax=Tenacibaculum maritimum TaxID=107401 RepID=UPI003875DB6C